MDDRLANLPVCCGLLGLRRYPPLSTLCRKVLGVLLLLLVMGASAGAAEVLERDFQVIRPDFEMRIVVRLEASREAVWAVLSDYEQLAALSPSMLESRIVASGEHQETLVATVTEGCLIALFCRTVHRVEAMEEDPPRRIRARVLPERSNLQHGVTDWLLEERGDATHVTVQTRLRPDFWVPPGIGPRQMRSLFMSDMTKLMEQVETRARQPTD